IRCLPPVDAPFRLIFRDRRLDRTRKFTKPLLYRLSYVGADFLVILARSEAASGGTPNLRPCGRDPDRHLSLTGLRELLNEWPGVRGRRAGVRAREFADVTLACPPGAGSGVPQ